MFNKKVAKHIINRMQNKLHTIGTYDNSKISLCCFDNKKYLLDDGINALGLFHKDTRRQ